MSSEQPNDPFYDVDLVTAVRLRWALRDIHGKHHKLLPVSPDDIATLERMGLIETRDDSLALTTAG